jgi:FtsZ-binding cell division protein ZapB
MNPGIADWKRKKPLAPLQNKVFALVAATLILPALAYAQDNSPLAKLQAQVTALQTQVNTQQGQITTLQSQVSSLQTSNTTLQSQVSSLQTSNTTLQSEVSGLQASNTTLQSQVSGLQTSNTTLQSQVSGLQTSNTTLQSQVSSLQTSNTALQSEVSGLQNQLTTAQPVLALAPFVSVDPNPENGVAGPNIKFTGANIHILSGSNATDDNLSTGGSLTGLGNLIIGYDENPPSTPTGYRGGSHNLVIGQFHTFTSDAFGGFVAGSQNTIYFRSSSVLGGSNNSAGGGSVLGGSFNDAESGSTVGGGFSNNAFGGDCSICGGRNNTALASTAVVIGGENIRTTVNNSIVPEPPF